MTLYQFTALDEQAQAQAAWDGRFLMLREYYEHTVVVYKVDEFYVEVFYQRESKAIDRIRAFGTKRLFTPYFHRCQN